MADNPNSGGEAVLLLPLDKLGALVPTTPIPIPETVGQNLTGIIVNEGVPAGVTLRIMRVGQPDGPIFTNGGSFIGWWPCGMKDGLAYSYDVPVPGGVVKVVAIAGPDNSGAAGGSYGA
jgi:hypothetical protein